MDAMHVNRFRCYYDDLSKVRFDPDIDFSHGVPVMIYDSSFGSSQVLSADSIIVMPSSFVVGTVEAIRNLDESVCPKQELHTVISLS
jgi:hypothetical protein